jgi:hypothetical protein
MSRPFESTTLFIRNQYYIVIVFDKLTVSCSSENCRVYTNIAHSGTQPSHSCPRYPLPTVQCQPLLSDSGALFCTFFALLKISSHLFSIVSALSVQKPMLALAHLLRRFLANFQCNSVPRITEQGSRAGNHGSPVCLDPVITTYFYSGCRPLLRMLRFSVP